ncbi:MAG TPA: hypothetical protein VGH65_03105, partial [Verrucomicrobiaceae bacterium]
VLDDAEHVGAWQLELRKRHDDPLEVDELILHVHKTGNVRENRLIRDLNNRFVAKTEIHPNRVVFHDAEEMRELQGVGVQIKEQKIIDNRKGPEHRLSRRTDDASSEPTVRTMKTMEMIR